MANFRRDPRSSTRASRGFNDARAAAQTRLRRYRRGSALAVALTGLFLLVSGTTDSPGQTPPDTTLTAVQGATEEAPPRDPAQSLEEATGTLRELASDFADFSPKILIALGLVVVAALLVRMARWILRRLLGEWEKADAATAMSGLLIWLIAIGVALSVVAGDARALLGSVGLLGLALSWALQAPIESFAGWVLNSFKGYYRVGDRIAVGEVFGDVYRIDSLTTTVWEAGGPNKPVQGAQPTGALITFPNSEVLRANVVNYTRGFPYVWDEVIIGVSNGSDLGHAMEVIRKTARDVVGETMSDPVEAYRTLLVREGLAYDISPEPQVYVSLAESWVDLTVRYLVPARERRKWSSLLLVEISRVIALPEHADRIHAAYPVRTVRLSGPGQ